MKDHVPSSIAQWHGRLKTVSERVTRSFLTPKVISTLYLYTTKFIICQWIVQVMENLEYHSRARHVTAGSRACDCNAFAFNFRGKEE